MTIGGLQNSKLGVNLALKFKLRFIVHYYNNIYQQKEYK